MKTEHHLGKDDATLQDNIYGYVKERNQNFQDFLISDESYWKTQSVSVPKYDPPFLLEIEIRLDFELLWFLLFFLAYLKRLEMKWDLKIMC